MTVLRDPVFAAHVADAVREPLLVLDAELRVIATNRAFHRVFGVSADETHGTAFDQLCGGRWHDPALGTLLEDVLVRHAEFEAYEMVGEFPGSGSRVMSLSGRQIPAPDGARRTILIALEDITERRATEEALAQRTRELEASNRELEQFAAVASHDLQEPLRKIRTYGELLRTRHAGTLESGALDYVERMSQAAGRMQTLIDDLLALARITAGSTPALTVDLRQAVREVLIDLEVALRDSGGSVEIGDLPTIVADPIQMRQLFQNLLSNAVKFRRTDAPVRIRVTAATASGGPPRTVPAYEIVVEDNGIGFSQRYAEQIFAPFARLHGRAEYGGSGIGLAICRRIVARHGGTITARSNDGAGAAFAVTLPAGTPQPRAIPFAKTLQPLESC